VEAAAAQEISAGGHNLLQGEPDGPERVPDQSIPYSQQLLHAMPRRLDEILWTQRHCPPLVLRSTSRSPLQPQLCASHAIRVKAEGADGAPPRGGSGNRVGGSLGEADGGRR